MFSRASALGAVLVAAVFGGAGGAAQADQLQDIMQRKELRCGTFADVPPFAAPDPKTREMVGFDVDLCGAIAKEFGVVAKITPLSVEARVPEVKLGHVDIAVANLAYTIGRASQIQFSDPYYVAKEMLAVKASDPGNTKKVDFKGKRLASTKGSTSELSIKLNGSDPLTFQDTGSVFMSVQQNKAAGMVVADDDNREACQGDRRRRASSSSDRRSDACSSRSASVWRMTSRWLLAKINETLAALDKAGEINQLWDKWLGPKTEYQLVRTEQVVPLSQLQFTPIP